MGKIDNLKEAHRTMLVQIASQNSIASLGYGRSFWSPIIKILNRGILKIAKNQQVVLVTGYEYGLNSLSQELNQAHGNLSTLSVSGSSGKFREVLKAVLSILRTLARKGNRKFTAVPTFSENKVKIVEQYFYWITDPVIKNALDFFKNSLISDVVLTDGLKKEIDILVKNLQIKAICAHYLRWGSAAMFR